MGKKCFVPNCRSGYKSCLERVSLFSPPRESERLKVWVKNISRTDRILSQNDRVCEKHFEAQYVINSWSDGLNTIILEMPRLSDDAVPTIFPGCPSYQNTNSKTRKRPLNRDIRSSEMRNKHRKMCVTDPVIDAADAGTSNNI